MFHRRADVVSGKAKSGIIKKRDDLFAGPTATPALETGKSRSRDDHENGGVAQLDKVDGKPFCCTEIGTAFTFGRLTLKATRYLLRTHARFGSRDDAPC
jgi:hypothetical protein